jgi:fluoride exporter
LLDLSSNQPDEASAARHETTLGSASAARHPRRALMLPPLGNLLAVAAGGMIGAALRVGFAVAFPALPGRFPWTTFAENVLGAFLLGMLLVLLLERWRPTRQVHPFLCTGILGSFTTFSNFSVEWVRLAGGERPWLAVVYPLASMIVGLVAALAGVVLARRWPPLINRKDAAWRSKDPAHG